MFFEMNLDLEFGIPWAWIWIFQRGVHIYIRSSQLYIFSEKQFRYTNGRNDTKSFPRLSGCAQPIGNKPNQTIQDPAEIAESCMLLAQEIEKVLS